jgi:hypothetical protein
MIDLQLEYTSYIIFDMAIISIARSKTSQINRTKISILKEAKLSG